MAREINELKAEIARLKLPPTTSKNSSQPPSRDLTKFTWHEAQKKLPKVYEKLLADLH